ncbi:molecular chaperone [Haloferax sp. YSMS24]|uniref:TorD/DmsD family molecular chaperone n=1 Tax=Haloferax sp. YSMS24 TaxID=3388425 RepID=UPI00398CD774
MDPLDDDVTSAAFARSRAQVYDLFAAVFDGDMAVLSAAIDDNAFERLEETLPADVDCDVLDQSFDAEALSFAYDNLFVVPGEHYVPPFASAHATDPSKPFESPSAYHDVGTAGEFLGQPAANVSHVYAQVGFEPERGDAIPDHVAAILEFQAVLCQTEADRRAAGDDVADLLELQRSGYSSLAWLDEFDDAVAERDTAVGVFATLTRLVRTFVAWDATRAATSATESESTMATDDADSDPLGATTPRQQTTQSLTTSTDDDR